MTAFEHILVAIDFGESSDDALALGIELARQFDAELTLVHSIEPPTYAYPTAEFVAVDFLTPIEQTSREQLETALAASRTRLPRAQAVLRQGRAADEILAVVAETHPDLVVVGTHGRHGIGRALLGSVAERVVRLSPVPVLTVRRRTPAAERDRVRPTTAT